MDAAAICRWAARLHGMLVERAHEAYPILVDLIDDLERDGFMPPVHDGSFTGFAHTPDQLRDEVVASGLALESLVSVEDPAFALGDLDERPDDDEQRAIHARHLPRRRNGPGPHGDRAHLLATARRKPAG